MKEFIKKNIFQIIIVLVIFSIFIILILGSLNTSTPKINMGVNTQRGEVSISAPENSDFILKNIDGNELQLSKYLGRPVVLDFWSSWCGPCIQEAQILSDAYIEWSSEGVEFIGIAIWDNEQNIKAFKDKYNIQYNIAMDNSGRTAVDFGIVAVPEKFFIYSDGSFAFKINGPNNKDSLDGYIVRLLNEDKKNK